MGCGMGDDSIPWECLLGTCRAKSSPTTCTHAYIQICLWLQGASLEACLAVFEDAAAWFGVWAAGGHGDVAHDEP